MLYPRFGTFNFFLESISNDTLAYNTDWYDSKSIFAYDCAALGKYLTAQAAAILNYFPINRVALALVPDERIAFNCLPILIDSLFPHLVNYDLDNTNSDEYNLYPTLSLVNLAQFL